MLESIEPSPPSSLGRAPEQVWCCPLPDLQLHSRETSTRPSRPALQSPRDWAQVLFSTCWQVIFHLSSLWQAASWGSVFSSVAGPQED